MLFPFDLQVLCHGFSSEAETTDNQWPYINLCWSAVHSGVSVKVDDKHPCMNTDVIYFKDNLDADEDFILK